MGILRVALVGAQLVLPVSQGASGTTFGATPVILPASSSPAPAAENARGQPVARARHGEEKAALDRLAAPGQDLAAQPPNNSLVPTFPQAFEGVDAQGRVCNLSDEQAMRLVADVDQIVVTTGNQSSAQPLLGLEQVHR
jgi:hypothetical protein